jgi:hypothetical protein
LEDILNILAEWSGGSKNEPTVPQYSRYNLLSMKEF